MARLTAYHRNQQGDGGDRGGNADHLVHCYGEPGDWVYWLAVTSDYRHVLRSDGPRWEWGGAGSGWHHLVWWPGQSGYGGAYICAAQIAVAGTHGIYSYFSGGNAGANYVHLRTQTWRDTEGFGHRNIYTRPDGAADWWVPQSRHSSSYAWISIDWYARRRTDWAAHTYNGVGSYFAGGAATYASGWWHWPGQPPADRLIGLHQPNNWRVSTAWVEIYGIDRDIHAPAVPTGVTATPTAVGQNTVRWNASADDYGTTGYQVKRNGVIVADLGNVLTWVDPNVVPGTLYTYTVNARDAAGNRSGDSVGASATGWLDRIRIGTTRPSKLYLGDSEVSNLYLGATRLWP